jgi:creatinine amidohydrolase
MTAERRARPPSQGRRLGPISTVDAAALARPVLIVPLGSTEQHGPHLPLDTDTRIATAWAEGVADRLAGAVAAPALPYGSAGEHQSFAGTLSIGQAALAAVVVELVRSAASSFAGVAVVCGHAGNAGPLATAAAKLDREAHNVIALYPSWRPDPARFGPIDAHAGRTETSLMLHLAPDLVRLDRAERGTTTPAGELLETMRRGGVAAASANGVLGDPRGASAGEGRRLLDDLIVRSVETLAVWSHGKRPC